MASMGVTPATESAVGASSSADTAVPPMSSAEARNSPPQTRTTVPPKRPLTTSKRPTTSSPPTVTKPAATTSSRASLSGSLNKPPTRPTVSSTPRRPPTTSTSTTPAHKSRASISSVDDKMKSGASGDDSRKPGITGSAKRISLAASTTRAPGPKNVSSMPDRRSAAQSSQVPDRRTAARVNTLSPTKNVRAPTTPASKLSSTTAPRTTRPLTSSTRGPTLGGSVTEGKKRLSTIPASPAVNKKPEVDTKAAETTQATQPQRKDAGEPPTRPTLGARRSTRSVALQQKIREFELVQGMLAAAMATEDDIDTGDVAKMEQEADRTMAKLKTDLARVQSYESKHGSYSTEDQLQAVTGEEPELRLANHDHEAEIAKLKDQLFASDAKIAALEVELKERQHTLEAFGKSAQSEATKVENAAQAIRAEHATKIDKLLSNHKIEMQTLQMELEAAQVAQRDSAERALKDLETARKSATDEHDSKTVQLLDQQKTSHLEALKQLEEDLATAREASASSKRQIQSLNHQVAKYSAELEEANQKGLEHSKTIEGHEGQLQRRADELNDQGSVMKRLQDELKSLQEAKENEATVAHDSTSKSIETLESKVSTLEAELDQSKIDASTSTTAHSEALGVKEEEIESLGKLVEKLQNEVQNVHETKNNELDSKVMQVGQEHESILEKVNAKHTAQIDDLTAAHSKSLETAKNEAATACTAFEQDLREVVRRHEAAQGELERLESEMAASKDSSEALAKKEAAHIKELETTQAKLHESEDALADMEKTLEQSRTDLEAATARRVSMLEGKISQLEAQAAKGGTDLETAHAKVKQSEQAVTSLEQVLKTLERESQDKDDHHLSSLKKARAEAEAAAKSLAEQQAGLAAASEDHTRALNELRATHKTELKTLMTGLEDKHKKALDDLQANHDELASNLKSFHEQHDRSQKALEVEHQSALDRQLDTVASLKDSHAAELNSLMANLNTHVASQQKLEEELGKLQEELAKAQQKAQQAAATANEVADYTKKVADLEEKIAKDQETIVKLTNAAEEASRVIQSSNKADEEANKAREELTEKHASESNGLRDQIETLRESQAAKDRDLQAAQLSHQESLNKNTTEMERKHASEILELKTQIQAQEDSHDAKFKHLEAAKQTGEELQSEKNAELEQKHASEVFELKQDIQALRDAHTTKDRELENSTMANQESLARRHAELEQKHATAISELQQQVQSLTEAQAAKERLLQTAREDHEESVGRDIAELQHSHASEISELQQQIQVHVDSKAKAEQELKRAWLAHEELNNLQTKLAGAEEQVEQHKSDYATVMDKLHELETSSQADQSLAAKLADLERSLEAANDNGITLAEQLQDAEVAAEKLQVRMRELEAQLKVTTAELTEAKTKRSNGVDFLQNPKLPGPSDSKWAPSSEVEKENVKPTSPASGSPSLALRGGGNSQHRNGSSGEEGEELGSVIQGSMASIREQLRQLDGMNEDMLAENMRIVDMLSKVERPVTASTGVPERKEVDFFRAE